MLVRRARSVNWKWAAKHEHEELKEGVRLEPALALLRKKVEGGVDREPAQCSQKAFLRRMMGAKETVRYLAGRMYHAPGNQSERFRFFF